MQLIGIGNRLSRRALIQLIYGSADTDLSHVFSDDEISYSGREESRFLHLAARFAAKRSGVEGLGLWNAGRHISRRYCGIQRAVGSPEVAA